MRKVNTQGQNQKSQPIIIFIICLIDINLLKPSRIEFVLDPVPTFDSARWGFPTQMVGVYLLDSTPCLALAAYEVG